MRYLKNVLKSFIFSHIAIKELSIESFLSNIVFFLLSNTIIIFIKIFLFGIADFNAIVRQIVFNLFFLFFEILFLFLLLKKYSNKKSFILLIAQPFLLTDFFFTFMLLINNHEILLYKLINGIINLYVIYYVFKFISVSLEKINKRKIEVYTILSVLFTKIFFIIIFVFYNGI